MLQKKKDDLTGLIEILGDGSDDTTPNNGQVTTSDGDVVTLDFEAEKQKLDRSLKTDAEKIDFLLQLVIKLHKENVELKKLDSKH